jgi:AP endonuclease-1
MSNASSESSLTELDSDDLLPPASAPTASSSSTDLPIERKTTTKAHSRKRKSTTVTESANGTVQVSQSTTTQVQVQVDISETPKPKRKRQKKEKDPVMPLAARIPSLLRIGAHVSAAKGVQNAITNAIHIGYVHFLVFKIDTAVETRLECS